MTNYKHHNKPHLKCYATELSLTKGPNYKQTIRCQYTHTKQKRKTSNMMYHHGLRCQFTHETKKKENQYDVSSRAPINLGRVPL